MAELNRSLTAMDWLPRLNARGALSAGGIWLEGVNDPPELVQADSSTPPSPPTNSKPPYSYANLITLAINSSSKRKMTLAEIYQWIIDNFPYYRQASAGWKCSGVELGVEWQTLEWQPPTMVDVAEDEGHTRTPQAVFTPRWHVAYGTPLENERTETILRVCLTLCPKVIHFIPPSDSKIVVTRLFRTLDNNSIINFR
ncbi:forkhead box protein J3-like [Penaeus monodon]|uniref:forkhead box protein J3-like n=1 Tax=Penaeus monodon TaxID=6687 RepID=UPI0018A71BFE|nr:forkhead box protein J3-like [Penaeus monodon]